MKRLKLDAVPRPEAMNPMGDFAYTVNHHRASAFGMGVTGGDTPSASHLPIRRFNKGGGGLLKGQVIA